MKAVTVAGGSSDDPEIESETTVRKTEPEPTAPTDAGARGTKSEPERGTVTEPDVEAEDAPAEPKAQAENPAGDADTRGPKAGQAEAETGADAATRKTHAGSESQADPRPGGEPDLSGEAELEDEADSDPKPATDAGPKTGTEATGAPRPPAGPKAPSENRSGVAGTRAPKAEPKAPAAPRPEDATRSNAQAEDAPAALEAQAEAPSGAAGTRGPRADRPEAEADAGAEAQSDPRPPAGPKAPAAPRPEDATRSDAQAEDASARSKEQGENPSGGSDARGPRVSRPAVRTGADAPKSRTGAEAQADPRSHAGPNAQAENRPGAAGTRGPKGEPGTGAEPKAQAEAGAAGTSGPRARRSAVGTGAGAPKSQTGAQGDPRPGGQPERSGEAELADEADSGAKPATDSAPKAGQAEAEAGADARKAHTRAEAQADSGTPAGPKVRAEERTGVADPRGPKDGQAEARAGGEGESEGAARSDADADAEPKAHGEGRAGGASGAGVDETQVIARPGVPPRTGPSWARDVEPDAERTSQFVALKDLDTPAPAPAPVAPRPAQPAAQGAPQPPLELLADLTNTPPPAETPRRTALRRVKIWTPILLLLVGAGAGAQLLRPLPAAQLVAAKSDHTVDGKFSIPWPAKGQGAVRVSGSGDLGSFGEQKPVPTASVAKVMTAYVILKDHPLRKSEPGPDITIDAKTVADGNSEHESRISGLTAGTKFSQQDMLKMLMIPSGNNVARLLARWDSGTDSEAAFVAKMNAAAKELGMTSTTYSDPSGLDAGTVSTAADQLKLAEAVMKDETFRSIVALPNATIKGLSQRLENNNILLNTQGLSIRGIKTGSSTPAGGTLMWAAYKSIGDETPLILGTLMDQRVDGPDEDGGNSLKLVLANSKTIIEAVRTALASVPVIRKGDVVGHVDDGLGGRTPLVAAKDLNVIGVPGQQVKLSLAPAAGGGPLPHTAKAGAEVGVLTVGSGEGARSVPVAVKGALVEPSFGTRLTRGR
ncbi:serine hydrolase [Streptomyces sp. NPDC085639]|uniref:serine hydrolase n=1 Tax=Streptomyces sp. NPDC085639 TaxID=3365734 RepID=UPI0037D789F8